MIIDLDMLVRFGACKLQRDEFAARFPNGLDVSGLWGTAEERSTTWRILLADEFLRRNAGWAIANGLVPARITANLRGANLTDATLWGANLWGANLTCANLTDANLTDANLWGADLTRANLKNADLRGTHYNETTIWPINFDLIQTGVGRTILSP